LPEKLLDLVEWYQIKETAFMLKSCWVLGLARESIVELVKVLEEELVGELGEYLAEKMAQAWGF
jgi:hypothetical protein